MGVCLERRLRGRCQRLGRASLPLRARSGPREGGETRSSAEDLRDPAASPETARRGDGWGFPQLQIPGPRRRGARGEPRHSGSAGPRPEAESSGAPLTLGAGTGETRESWAGAVGAPQEGRQRRCRVKQSQITRSGEAGLQLRSASLPRSPARWRAPVVPGCPPHTGGSIVNRDLGPSPLGQRESGRVGGDAPSS